MKQKGIWQYVLRVQIHYSYVSALEAALFFAKIVYQKT